MLFLDLKKTKQLSTVYAHEGTKLLILLSSTPRVHLLIVAFTFNHFTSDQRPNQPTNYPYAK